MVAAGGTAEPGEFDEAAFEALKTKIHADRGFNCQFYKEKCLRRRIAVRMRARGVPTLEAYTRLLDSDESEYDLLLNVLTINVSKFFRNIEMWRVVERVIVPWLLEPADETRHIWSAGCAAGEEPYTISILLQEWARAHQRESALRRIRILGTDIDARSLEAARLAIYPELALAETPPEIRDRWFHEGPPFPLRKGARRRVEFRRHDMISEPPPEAQHLIVCRNVIIYFDRTLQDRLFQQFHDALVPGGYLVLGKVETLLGPARGLFEAVDNRERVFRKRV